MTADPIIVTARCCRDWPVMMFVRIGRCGYCGQVPIVVGPDPLEAPDER